MSMSVTVLCPGGRRQVVKITPNTSILQILEEACTKQKLDAKMFNLLHYNKTLDVSSTVRFANLPNRAQLELAASEHSRVDSDVTLATQLTDGRRLVKLVSCNSSLWEVLEEQQLLPSTEEDLVPVCIYTRNEVAGEAALRATTLRSLGLTGGKAIIRFATRPSSHVSGGQAHVSAPLVRPTAPEPMDSEPASSPGQSAAELPAVDQSQPTVTAQPTVGSQSKPVAVAPKAAVVQSQTVIADVTSSDVKSAGNDVTISSSDPVLSVPASSAAIATPSPPNSEATGSTAPSTDSLASKGSVDVFLTEGASLGSAGSSESRIYSPEMPEERIVYLGEHQAVAYSLDDITGAQPELPDDFYDITEEDVRRRMRQLRQDVASLEEGGALLTAQQREARQQADLLTRLSAHRHCVIRAQFPDRLVLQAVFLSTDTVASVTELISTHLSHPADQLSLYTTPPRTTLPPAARLFEVGCVPAALVHVTAAGGATVALSASVRSRLSSPAGAALALRRTRPGAADSSPGSSVAGCSSSESAAEARARASRVTAAARTRPPTRPDAPKWFKLGTK